MSPQGTPADKPNPPPRARYGGVIITEFGIEKTVLLSTHIMQEVDKTCDRVIIINKGVIVADNLMSQLRKDKVNLEDHFRDLTSN